MSIIYYIIYFAISLYMMNQARSTDKEKPKAATLDQFDFPTADETRSIPFGYGTYEVNGPNVLWYGDYRVKTIYKKVKTGGFFGLFQSTEKIDQGFAYSVGIQFGLCFGDTQLKKIKIDNKEIYKTENEGTFTGNINNNTFFGEYENGPGGISGDFTFYSGKKTQSSDSYLINQLGNNVPYYNDISHLVWKGGYIGNNSSLSPWAFVLKRIIVPHWAKPNMSDINGSCNAASVIYDLLTNKDYGIGLSDSQINIDNFREIHETLFNEGFGVSFLINSDKNIEDIVNDVLKVIEGQININFLDGKIEIRLNREETPELTFNEDNIISLTNYSRGSLTSLINEVKIKWTDIHDNFKSKISQFQNEGSRFERDRAETTIIDYSILNNARLAQEIAYREAIPLTTPLLKCDITVNRKAYNIKPGDVVYLQWPKLGIDNIIMRVLEVDYGTLKNSKIKLNLIQDRFGIHHSLYSESPTNYWTGIDFKALNCDLKLIEAPFFFNSEDGNKNKILTFSVKPNSSHNNYDLLTRQSSDGYILNGVSSGFCPAGSLSLSINELSNTIELNNISDLNIVVNETEDRIKAGYNLAVIIENDIIEFINFKEIENNSNNVYKLLNVNRALIDTIPRKFTENAKIYFFSYGFAINNNETLDNLLIRVKAITRTANYTLEEDLASVNNITLTGIKNLPIAPSNLKINGFNYEESITTGKELLSLTWSNRDKDIIIKNYNENTTINNDSNQFIIDIYDDITNTLLKSEIVNNLSYVFNDELTISSTGLYYDRLRVILKSKNNNLDSLYNYAIIINRI